jgi:hypothetical protein
MLIFPSTLRNLWYYFKIPADLQQTGDFVVALIPWTMTPTQYSDYNICSGLSSFTPPEFNPCPTTQAIQFLGFPHDLRKYMQTPHHPFCVWWSPSDGTLTAPGLETTLLLKIMKACRAKKVEAGDPKLRVVFVHVGALESLHRLSAVTKRRRQLDIHFFSYGSHPRIPREQWGVRAIYPLGKLFRMRLCLFFLIVGTLRRHRDLYS